MIHLQAFLKPEVQEFHVRREYIFDDVLQETKKSWFHPLKRVKVNEYEYTGIGYINVLYLKTWFIGENGRDTGGVTRELWRLMGLSLMKLCEGQPSRLVFRRDSERVVVSSGILEKSVSLLMDVCYIFYITFIFFKVRRIQAYWHPSRNVVVEWWFWVPIFCSSHIQLHLRPRCV